MPVDRDGDVFRYIPFRRRRNTGGTGDFGSFMEEWSKTHGEDEDGPKPIGVPEGYAAVRRPIFGAGLAGGSIRAREQPDGGAYKRPAQYFDGDEWKPANLRADSVAAIQRAMVEAGILGWGDFNYKIWDNKTADAYKEVLSVANAQGVTDRMALTQMAMSGGAYGRGGGGQGGEGGGQGEFIGFDENGEPMFAPFQPPPLELKTSNKKDLHRVFRKSIIEELGEGWSEEDISEMVDAYNWREIQVQKEAYDKEVGLMRREFGGEDIGGEVITSVDVESPETFLEERARAKDPVGYGAGQLTNNYIPAFMEMMEGWG